MKRKMKKTNEEKTIEVPQKMNARYSSQIKKKLNNQEQKTK